VKIGLAVAVPEGANGSIAPWSGLATKGITGDAGVVDADYRGEVKVLHVNHGKWDYEVKIGECNVLYLVMGHPLVMGHYFHLVKSNKTYNNSLTIYLEKLIFE